MTIVCIAGAHRSGTSMVARLLNLCGLYLGEERDLLPLTLDNPEGYWENYHFVNLNDKILSDFDGGWDLPPAFESGWENLPVMASYRGEAEKLIEDMKSHIPWGWKDPRNSLTLPFWRKLIPDLKVVVCLRNPFEVAQSLSKRGYSSLSFGLHLWFLYYQQLLKGIPEQNCIFTHYDAFFLNGKAELGRIVSFLELAMEEHDIDQACTFINSTLKHNNTLLTDMSDFNSYTDVNDMYSNLCAKAGPVFQTFLQKPPRDGNDSYGVFKNEKTDEAEDGIPEKLIVGIRSRLVKNTSIIQSMEQQLNYQEQSMQMVQSLVAHLADMETSNAWQIGLLFRRFGALIAPPNSRRDRLMQKGLNFIVFLFNRSNRNPNTETDLALVRSSGLFDETWYLDNNPDVADARMNPVRHYVQFGGSEGRDPGPRFSSGWYLDTYEDVKKSGINPLVHFLKYGISEGRKVRPALKMQSPLQKGDEKY
jgi:hypothetical protein